MTRKSPSEDLKAVFTHGAERLASGISVVIFPQSTRSLVFNPEEFNTLGVKLAKRAGVPVIPVAIKTDFLGVGKVLKEFGPVHRDRDVWFEFGEEMPVTGNGKEEHQRIVEFISGRLRSWGMTVAGDPAAP